MDINEFPATNGDVSPTGYGIPENWTAVFTGTNWVATIAGR
jgi:hypothetical protein